MGVEYGAPGGLVQVSPRGKRTWRWPRGPRAVWGFGHSLEAKSVGFADGRRGWRVRETPDLLLPSSGPGWRQAFHKYL